ncbi:MAG: ATP cone domain-containing protein [bacterium]
MVEHRIEKVMKRDGTIVDFDQEKVTIAIYKAAAAVGGHDRALSEKLSDEAVEIISHSFEPPDVPTVEEVQDIVEKVLIENGHAKTAKAYILYRESRRRERERKGATKRHQRPLPFQLMYEQFLWNIDHDCETTEKLNRRVKDGTYPELIRDSDARYTESIAMAAESVARFKAQIRIIIVAGPSSSGKTTTTAKLAARLRELGIDTEPLNLDHYFFNLELHPKDEYGDYDFETPEALDLQLINDHLADLVDGKTVDMPQYDFKTGTRSKETRKVKFHPDKVILIDTLHGLHPPLTASVDDDLKFKVYIETISMLRDSERNFVRWTDVRLLRRMVRDHSQRAYDPMQTVGHWHYVRRSELKHIIPFIRNADYILNGALPYELPVLKKYEFEYFPKVMDQWRGERKRRDAFIRAERIYRLLSEIEVFEDESVIPDDSLLREFIGGSIYKLH